MTKFIVLALLLATIGNQYVESFKTLQSERIAKIENILNQAK